MFGFLIRLDNPINQSLATASSVFSLLADALRFSSMGSNPSMTYFLDSASFNFACARLNPKGGFTYLPNAISRRFLLIV